MTAIEPAAVARLSRTMESHGYSPAEAFSRAGSLLAAHAELQTERPIKYSATAYAQSPGRQQYGQDAPTATLEPDERDKALFLHHLRKRGLHHLITASGPVPELPADYAATDQDDQAFDQLLRHYGMHRMMQQTPARQSATAPQPAPPGAPPSPAADPFQAMPPAGTEPEFTQEDMQRAHAYQIENPGATFDQAKAAIRNSAGRRYTASEFKEMAMRNNPLTKESMDAAHRYQATHPGVTFKDACLVVFDTVQRYALARSGTHEIPNDPHYVGTGPGAVAWMRDQTSEHRRRLQEQKAERKRMSDLANRHGVPLHVAAQSLEMASADGVSVESALSMLIDRERNKNLFGNPSGGLPFSITTMK